MTARGIKQPAGLDIWYPCVFEPDVIWQMTACYKDSPLIHFQSLVAGSDMSRRRIQLVQLPIPQPGMEPARGNVPLAAGYLKLYAQQCGLTDDYDIDIFPSSLANTLSDVGLVDAILDRRPWMVGFTCYLWNIERSLLVVQLLKARCPELQVILGGPEITADNAWVLARQEVDYAAIGEGEQTFSELLADLRTHDRPSRPIDGLHVAVRGESSSPLSLPVFSQPLLPAFRKPLPKLDVVSSPYLAGILDAADEKMLLLETLRGCIFKCKFCYYPKSYDALYFVSQEKIEANLKHARDRGAEEVVILDPTLNQRKDFADFVRLLAKGNPDRQFKYFGELRAEGITPEIAKLLAEANFTEVEIGLQSVDPLAMDLMDRRNNFKAFERGVHALMDVGIQVKVDLIIGLPGDTEDSIRRGFHYVHDSGLYDDIQVFNLSILPGTAFRQEAEQLGLRFQPRPPYYVLETPTLQIEQFYGLMAEAEELFEREFDAHGAPEIDFPNERFPESGAYRLHVVDLDRSEAERPQIPAPGQRAQAFTLWIKGSRFKPHRKLITAAIRQILEETPHTTLQIVIEPTGSPLEVTPAFLEALREACLEQVSYLDRFYAILPGRWHGAKRLVIVIPSSWRDQVELDWIDEMGEFASIVWVGGGELNEEELEPHEYLAGATSE